MPHRPYNPSTPRPLSACLLAAATILTLAGLTACSSGPAHATSQRRGPRPLAFTPPPAESWNTVLPAPAVVADPASASEYSLDFDRNDRHLALASGPAGASVQYYPTTPAPSLDYYRRVTFSTQANQVTAFRAGSYSHFPHSPHYTQFPAERPNWRP